MSAPVLFLDIDGVLNHHRTTQRHNGFIGLDPENVERLNEIMRAVPDARIVVSSTWRLTHPLCELRGLLRAAGFAFPERVVGATPPWRTVSGSLVGAYEARGHEIQAWIEAQPVRPSAIAILDDAEDMVHLDERLVRTDLWGGGLLAEHVPAVVAKLSEVA